MFGADFYRDPYPVYSGLRAAGDMHFSEAFGGRGTWLVPRYEGAARVFNDPGLSAVRSHRFFDQYSPQVRQELEEFARVFKQWVVFLDPPDHGVWRKVMMAGFAAHRVRRMQADVERAVDALLDDAEGAGTFDFIGKFAYLLPILVVAAVMGVDARETPRFLAWAEDIASFFGNPGAPAAAARKAQEAVLALHAHFRGLVAQRIAEPRDDAVTLMVQALQALPMDEEARHACIHDVLPAQCAGLLFAGHETTSNLIGNAMHALFRHPQQLEDFVARPELGPQVVREAIRYDTSAQFSSRLVEQAFEFCAVRLEPGQIVIALTGSANRDERVFSQPQEFRIGRTGEPQPLTFGNGRHYCLGSHLAILEMELALRKLVTRFPRLQPLSQELEWTANFNFRGLRSMQVRIN
ncbi:cytochrome P450 [Ramlibacter sp.]|uniref:cytochrome P450 n=1 Tax=Ramlibacter sp. TaxID=1917967 RepID=UPI0017CAC8A4|nr:cytochrome P450 [Ramlibacter sp.]MBA2673347.1 cytochrome P450 [Ramlibacter sp.]